MNLIRYGELLATFSSTGSQYSATISRLHTLTETMFVVSLSVVRLECSLHFYAVLFFDFLVSVQTGRSALECAKTSRRWQTLPTSGCKDRHYFLIGKDLHLNILA